jgi:UDP-N-acetylglucosamine acyltransferase
VSVHSAAIVDSQTKMGKDVQIDAYAVIGPGVVLGDGCHIYPHTYLEHTTLGAACQVFPQVSLGLPPQHLLYRGEPTRLTVGNRVTFRESVTAHRGMPSAGGETRIGDDCFIMALSHIAHDCRVGNNVIFANGAQLAGHVEVGNNVFVSTTVGIHQFVRIGRGAMISGGAMVPLDVAPFCIAQGDRAELRGLNVVGMRRSGMDRTTISAVKAAYKAVFISGLTLGEALQSPELGVDNDAVRDFRSFLSQPKRGFLRPPSRISALALTDSEESQA